MTYDPTLKQEQAIREWLQEAIVPLIEQVLVKKLGQAMSFAAKEVVQPQRKPLTDVDQIAEALRRHGLTLVKTATGYDVLKLGQIAAHGIKGDA